MRNAAIVLVPLALLAIVGCRGPQVAPAIPDTPEARAIIEVLESYRKAMEARDVDAILAIASRTYHDNMGSPDPETDIYFHDLDLKLAEDFEQVRRIRLDMEVLRIEMHESEIEGGPPIATVRYRYDVRYQLSMPSGEKWHNSLDVNQMMLQLEDDGAWRVLSGL